MKLFKRLNLYWIITLFIIIRLILINVNVTEVGDSYNILSATRALFGGFYPPEEKRLPLLPLLLAPGELLKQPILWGRLLSILLSGLSLLLLAKIGELFKLKSVQIQALLLLLIFNPLFFYWSGRIMTDVLFLTIVLGILYVLTRPYRSIYWQSLYVGILTGLALLTRFEGWLVLFVVVACLIYRNRSYLIALNVVSSSLLMLLPWGLYNLYRFGNPFITPYANEVSSSIPNATEMGSYMLHLLFLFGPLSLTFILEGIKVSLDKYRQLIIPYILLILCYLPLTAYWIAAQPRLFLTITPCLALLFMIGAPATKLQTHLSSLWLGLLCWAVGVVILPAEFLRGSFGGYLIILSLNLGCLIILSVKHTRLSLLQSRYWLVLIICTILASNVIVGTSVIYRAKDRGLTLITLIKNLKLAGTIGYADETGISSFYLNNVGLYWTYDTGYPETLKWLRDHEIKYIIVTNEHVEEGANFDVVYDLDSQAQFKRTERYERNEPIDPFNRIIYRMIGKPLKPTEVKYSEVYEVFNSQFH